MDFHPHDGAPTGPMMEEVSESEVLAGRSGSGEEFRRRTRNEGEEKPPVDGGSWADLYDAEAWDGVSYGYPVYRLTWNRNRSIHIESH
jgi:hypothetical protein